MSGIIELLNELPVEDLLERSESADHSDVRVALTKERRGLREFAALISPVAGDMLEELANASAKLTTQRFGKTVQLYAPLYVSNECVNVCTYCGFRRDIDIARSTLAKLEIEREVKFLTDQGFRHVLIVAGEHPKDIDLDYLCEAVRIARRFAPSVSVEVQPFSVEGYERLVEAGADGVTLYQEVYDRDLYAGYHTHGPKKQFDERLEGPDRAGEAGIRRLGIGTLLGLAPWRREMILLAAHAGHLIRTHWQSHISISFPRIRAAASGFDSPWPVRDRELAQMVCALRLIHPDAGLVLSTRESMEFRDGMVRLGITQMSAGSKTEPGGYLHPDEAEGQFAVSDPRTAAEVAEKLTELGFDPVWKDWEEALHG